VGHPLPSGCRVFIVLLFLLTIMAPLAMSFVDPWGDILEEQNADSFVEDTSNDAMIVI
jgi:hypothetical protein